MDNSFVMLKDKYGRSYIANKDNLDNEQRQFLIDFAKQFTKTYSDMKDIMRAENCHGNVIKAKSQLKRITDISKFYRRLKAFLYHNIPITDIKDTAFDRMNSEPFEEWLAAIYPICSNNTLPVEKKNYLINEMAEIYGN